MDKKTQDLAWTCLPKEVRDEIIKMYKAQDPLFHPEENDVIDWLFGEHNLESDTEPEEMLMVERKKVQDRFNTFNNPNWASNDEEAYGAQLVIDTLDLLFGDKCLPDKPSVQGEPKFKYNIGDLVTYRGKVKKIKHRYSGGELIMYNVTLLNGQSPLTFEESDLEPYTEPKPKFKVGDKVRISLNPKNPFDEPKWLPEMDKFKGQIVTLAKQDPDGDWKIEEGQIKFSYSERWLEPYSEPETKEDAPRPHKYSVGQKVLNHYCKSEILTIGGLAGHANKNNPRYRVLDSPFLWNECELDPYTETSNVSGNDTKDETKGNMEEKLNLAELLKGCEGEDIFSTFEGNMTITKVTDSNIVLHGHNTDLHCGNGFYPSGICQLYPSRALYEKYPLDAKKAWDEWASGRKPVYELKVYYQIAGNNNDDEVGQFNTIRCNSLQEARQAAEAVSETLMNFHERANDK